MIKGQFIIVDLRDMTPFKDLEGNMYIYDTEQEAGETCGMYEFENAWILELKYNYIDEEQ